MSESKSLVQATYNLLIRGISSKDVPRRKQRAKDIQYKGHKGQGEIKGTGDKLFREDTELCTNCELQGKVTQQNGRQLQNENKSFQTF